jgi:hypothetical protein
MLTEMLEQSHIELPFNQRFPNYHKLHSHSSATMDETKLSALWTKKHATTSNHHL